jgi:uncharacterized Tic20 family protein
MATHQHGPADGDSHSPGRPTPADRNWAVLCHLGGLGFYLLPVVFGGVLVSFALWRTKRHDSVFVDQNGREALNFQIAVLLGGAAVIAAGLFVNEALGYLLILPLVAFHAVFTVIGAVRADRGEVYRYPLTIRFV